MDERGLAFTAVSARGTNSNRSFRVPLLGRHQAVNALLTIAAAAELGLSTR